jgi:immune inhibitor A
MRREKDGHGVKEGLDMDRSPTWAERTAKASNPCGVAPSPALLERIKSERRSLRRADRTPAPAFLTFRQPSRPGLNDGTIVPADRFPLGTPGWRVRRAAAERAPLRGTLRVIVVLVEFSDKQMTRAASEFEKLFFSTGELPDGSVREYFTEASHGLVTIDGEVVGPYRLPRKLSDYAHAESGMGTGAPNAQTMARDAAVAANPDVDFGPYDNDGNGFVDAFIIIHAGRGAEETGNGGDIWSHKWTLSGSEFRADGASIFAYLTVPEDSKIGVCAHELGHLLFGWPDLYDIDNSSSGLGDWCLMAGGSWNGAGDVPAHPSAWCKAQQGWVSVSNVRTRWHVNVRDSKAGPSFRAYRLWSGGSAGSEYFLVENRQRDGYDRELPSAGLLVYHVDDSIDSNADESHYKVALTQADGRRDLEAGTNQGDAGDPYPGSGANTDLSGSSTPNTNSHAGLPTNVAIRAIGSSGATISVDFDVTASGAGTDPTLRRGARGPDVARLQQALINLGFDPGPVDGIFGPKTDAAVRAYQRSRGLAADGIVGPLTWASLHADGQ